MRDRIAACLVVLVFIFGTALDYYAQKHGSTASEIPAQQIAYPELRWSPNDKPVKVSLCDLKNDPPAYNHRLVELTGFVSHGFEDFTFSDPKCPEFPNVWLEYGGTTVSGTMYCCGVTSARSRPKQLVVENIPIELTVDENFKQFDKLIQRGPDSLVHATIVGRYFAGAQTDMGEKRVWSGYGHMGCCSLLAIQQVASVDQQTSRELDYRSWTDQPDLNDGSCGYKILNEIARPDLLIKDQELADREQADWRFTDPKRVATENLATLLKIDTSTIELKQTRSAQGRFIYQWRPKGKTTSYMIVVSRPYLLSFYSRDPNRVAWVVVGAFEKGCGLR